MTRAASAAVTFMSERKVAYCVRLTVCEISKFKTKRERASEPSQI